MRDPHKNTDSTVMKEKAQKLISDAPRRWAEATLTILVTVGVLAFLGKYLDGVFNTKPWLFIAGIVIAFPLSQYAVYRQLKKRFKF